MSRLRSVLFVAVALLPAFALAEPHPRAVELLEITDRFLSGGRESAQPLETLSMNISMRYFDEQGEIDGTALSSVAVDFERRWMRHRTCQEGQLSDDSVYRDGMLNAWSRRDNRLTSEDAGDFGFEQLFEQAVTSPLDIFQVDYNEVRYDGHVDYGLLAGEQVTLTVPGANMFGIPAIAAEAKAVFSAEGLLLGERIETGGGPMVVLFDGFQLVESGRMPEAMTLYFQDDEGGWQKFGTLRRWSVKVNEALPSGIFELVHPGDPADSAERQALQARSDEIRAWFKESESVPDDEFDLDEAERLIQEMYEINSRLLEFASIPCPEPF